MKGIRNVISAIALMGMAFTLSGCLVEMLATTAITADMAAQNAGQMQGAMHDAQIDVDMIRLQEAVDLYAAEKESYPPDLSVLVPTHIEAIPVRPDGKPFGYNPIEGEIYESGDGPAPADYFTMEKIKTAINNYGMSTGYYPATLDALYPTFMPTLPRTANGQQFTYNKDNGQLTHPDEGKQYAAAASQGMDSGTAVSQPVAPVNAIGSLEKGDLKDSNSLNKALDRMGY